MRLRFLAWMFAIGAMAPGAARAQDLPSKPLGIGLVALAPALAGLGYVVQVAWRAHVVLTWRRRAPHRRRR